MKEPDYQQRILQLEGELRESREREAGLLGRLEEAALELRHTMAQVADLERLVGKGQRDLRNCRMRYEEEQEQLMIANRATREELKPSVVRNQLGGATRDLSDTRRDKESLEVHISIHECERSVQLCTVLCCVQWNLIQSPVGPPNIAAIVVRWWCRGGRLP